MDTGGAQRNPVGTERLLAYWSEGEGLAKWRDSPHPWTTLRDLLLKYVSPAIADGLASHIFHRAMGYWPSERHRDGSH